MDSGGKSSLLDVVKRRFDEGLGRESVTRMLYIGIIPAGVDKRTVCDSHVEFLEEMDADVSGLMLVQQNTVLNLIEAAGDVVTALLRHMHTESLRESPCISDVRIVSVVEDCPSRAFVSWSYRSVSLAAEPGWKVEGDTLDLAYDMYSKIVAIGRQLTNSELSHEEQYVQFCRCAKCSTLDLSSETKFWIT